MTERILVLRGGALGDFVLGLPALEALREGYPGATLQLLAPRAVLPLASHLVDDGIPLERSEAAWLFAEATDAPAEIMEGFGGADLAVLWMADRSGTLRANLERLGTRRVLWAPALPPTPTLHAADHLMDTLSPLGIPLAFPAIPSLVPSEAAVEKAEGILRTLGLDPERPAVAIHPGSGGDWKRWPAERFAGVADLLMESNVQVVLLRGPADEKATSEMQSSMRGEAPVAADLGAIELAALLSRLSCYLGNDSGVTHLAAAVGIAVVALFGPTDPALWAPRGPRVKILRAGEAPGPSLERLEVGSVLGAVGSSITAGG